MNAKQVAEWLALFLEPSQVTELRAVHVTDANGRWPHTESGFFDYAHLHDMAREALRLTQRAAGVYFIPNPVHPDLLARCANRTSHGRRDALVSDAHILRRKWFLIDADPKRLADISSSDDEKARALEVILSIRDYMTRAGFQRWVMADSGNGYHLLYPIDVATEDGGMVRHIIQAIARKFSNEQVAIDTTVHNPARIVKLYGTLSRKGDSTPTRPHRWSLVMEYQL